MNQDLQDIVPETAPAEASPPAQELSETAFAEHLRLLDNALAMARSRVQRQEEHLDYLQAQVRRFREGFEELKTRAEDTELCLPVMVRDSGGSRTGMPPPLAVRPGPRLSSLWPYALLAAAALVLAPRPPLQMPQLQAGTAARPAPALDPGAAEAVSMVRSFKPQGSRRNFGELLAPKLGSLSESAWEVQRVGDGIYLVSFRPQGPFGPESAYEFTVDIGERTVTPEMDTSARLFAGVSSS